MTNSLLRHDLFIAGEWVPALSGNRFAVHDPASGALLAEVADGGATDAERAIEAAQTALPAWKALTGKARAALLRRWYDLIVAHADEIAALMTAEQGKNTAEAHGEITYGASFVEWFAEEAKRIHGDVLPTPDAGKRMLVLKQPVGVCAAITPWNFPFAMVTRKCAPALAAGCTIVLKPAEQTPLTALALVVLAERAGFPAGVINIVTADRAGSLAVGQALCDSPVVRHLSFTGSTDVGRILMAPAALP